MGDLALKCGGTDNGVDTFLPHCTLLYNFPTPNDLPSSSSSISASSSSSSNNEDENYLMEKRRKDEEAFSMDLLQKSLEKFNTINSAVDRPSSARKMGWDSEIRSSVLPQSRDSVLSPPTHNPSQDAVIDIKLIPKSFYFFPYPKEADGGKGFGCVISMILLENNNDLLRMHQATASVFPSDERHCQDPNHNQGEGGSGAYDTKDTSDDLKGCKIEGVKFIPHMALVYAPENYQTWLELETKKMNASKRHLLNPMKARCMSVWSTEGQIKDWRIIARIIL